MVNGTRRGMLGKVMSEWFDLEGIVTMTAAEAFTETEVYIPTSPFSGLALEIARIESHVIPPAEESAGIAEFAQFQICKSTKAAMVAQNDDDLLYLHELYMLCDSTPDLVGKLGSRMKTDKFTDFGLLILGNKLFLGIDNSDSGGAKSAYYKITCRLRKLTNEEVGKLTNAEYWQE